MSLDEVGWIVIGWIKKSGNWLSFEILFYCIYTPNKQKFNEAAETARQISQLVTKEEWMEVYGLYKQAVEGDNYRGERGSYFHWKLLNVGHFQTNCQEDQVWVISEEKPYGKHGSIS